LRLFNLLIIQINPTNAIKQATPRTAPTAAPTTVVVLLEFESLDGVAVTVDVTVAVASVEVPGITLLIKRPRYAVLPASIM
jgi:hypothetical protein